MVIQIKAITLGPTGAGKSSFLSRIINNKFSKSTLPTIGVDFFSKDYPQKNAKVIFWDTAGQEYYNSLNISYYRNSSIIICLFDIHDINGIDDVIKKLEECKHYSPDNNFVSLIANKCDIDVSPDTLQSIAPKIQKFCEKYNAKYYQISCLTGNNCNESINEIIDNCLKNHKEEESMETIVLVPPTTIPNQPCKKLCCRF